MKNRNLIKLLVLAIAFNATQTYAQEPLLTNVQARNNISLNGKWQYIIDPYETGFYDYRYKEKDQNDGQAYWNSDKPRNEKTGRKEFGYSDKYLLNVPGDWNSQEAKFLYYEGTVWYKKSFDFKKASNSNIVYLYFGAVNYQADVYLNGKKLGTHRGGFTPFNFRIPDSLLLPANNYLVVKVDNKRKADEIPALNADWWNFGGITRDVMLVEVPELFIRDYAIQLKKNTTNEIEGWVKTNKGSVEKVTIEIPELKFKKEITATSDSFSFTHKLPKLQLWSPGNPKLYSVLLRSGADVITEKIGFRTIEVQGTNVLLNGTPVFFRGICLHEEIPQEMRRSYSKNDAARLFAMVKELNANLVRLAHYPHSEYMTRMADSLGILVWSEIPVYWTIDFTNQDVLNKAKVQLQEMITRDRNRASIIIWSVGNETPVSTSRNTFMASLIATAKSLDPSRIISAALEINVDKGEVTIEDSLVALTDVISVNEYFGWYLGLPNNVPMVKWEIKYNKPLFISETGAEALGGFHADSLTRWSEEFQEWFYQEQIKMMKRMPANFVGLSPWILSDFRSPKRNNPMYQEGWNNKGLFDQKGRKKKAFYVLKAFYDEIEKNNSF
ncbi:MAG: glycoside hydrolase family 2 TIM barrel-domain containing protein [Ferruginibacter sp.]